MELKTPHVIPSSPAKASSAVTYNPLDLVDIDLTTPQRPSVVENPAVGTGSGSGPRNPPSGTIIFPTVALPITSAGANPTATLQVTTSVGAKPNGKRDLVQSSNPSVGMDASLHASSVRTGCLLSQPTYDVQKTKTKNCREQRQISASVDNGKCFRPMANQTPASSVVPNLTNVDIRSTLITEAVAKEAFLEYAKSKCCYGTAPAKRMSLQELRPFNAYRYCLETFTESRVCEWITQPYTGQTVSSSASESVPQPWDIPAVVLNIFKDGVQKMVVPNTMAVKACPRCNGLGRNMCPKCNGTGRVQCMWCNGTGRRMQMEVCHSCYGNGTDSCRMCSPNSAQCCATCVGKGQVVIFMQLTVTWKNNIFEFITDYNAEFSKELFKDVKGEKIFTEEQVTLSPVAHFPDQSLTRASQNALEQHQMQFSSSCRILRQRQRIELLPLTMVQYSWKENRSSYFVYGKENKVFVQSYPQKCCCLIL